MKLQIICRLIVLMTLFTGVGCKKYLEKKPDIKLSTPETLEDLEAIMHNENALNVSVYPSMLEVASDDYYVSFSDWQSQPLDYRANYVWSPDAEEMLSWARPYILVYNANVVMDNISKVASADTVRSNTVLGYAHFFRAYGFYFLTQLYCKPYDKTTAQFDLGIPLRTTADINITFQRSNVQEAYEQIIDDLMKASLKLPARSSRPTRPTKPAAFGALARVYLIMGDYVNAGKFADSALSYRSELIDYNTLNTAQNNPIAQYNPEVIFDAFATTGPMLQSNRARIDSTLIDQYENDDLRKPVFFKQNLDGSYYFRAYYSGLTHSHFFTGVTTSELYLIKAECEVRMGNVTEGMNYLNTLLANRWLSGAFTPIEASTAQEALGIVVKERRKELVFRGLRWTDIRRLNKEPAFRITLKRILDDGITRSEYELPPGDSRFVLLIPAEIVRLGGIRQNER